MSDNFTPLPSAGTSSRRLFVTPKQIVGGVVTLGLLIAIGSGVFLVNKVQNSATKAYSTDQCTGQGGYEWDATVGCPSNASSIGTIDGGTGTQDGGAAQTPGGTTSTGGNHICCVPNKTEQTQPTVFQAQETPIVQNTPPAENATKPPEPPSCKDINLPQPVINIPCPGGCEAQQ